MPSMIITKANAKENLGEFTCLSITKAKKLEIFMCNHGRADGNCGRQYLVLDAISKLRGSKITFDLGFRIKYVYYVGQSC